MLETRAACAREAVSQHMNTEHVSVPEDFSDVGLAEIFLHHRVLFVPIERNGRPIGVVARRGSSGTSPNPSSLAAPPLVTYQVGGQRGRHRFEDVRQ
jgi:hypothetical protein